MRKLSDYEIEQLWQELEDVLVDENDCLCDDWRDWPKGTHREEIWYWFDEHHSRGVGWLMNEYNAEETKTLNVRIWCQASYDGEIEVPRSMTLEEAIEYAKEHIEEIPLGAMDHLAYSDEIDEEGCEFEED